jgi:hypothetical protein
VPFLQSMVGALALVAYCENEDQSNECGEAGREELFDPVPWLSRRLQMRKAVSAQRPQRRASFIL